MKNNSTYEIFCFKIHFIKFVHKDLKFHVNTKLYLKYILLYILYFSLFLNAMHKHLNITDMARQYTKTSMLLSLWTLKCLFGILFAVYSLYVRPHRNSAPVSPDALHSTVEKQHPLGLTVHLICIWVTSSPLQLHCFQTVFILKPPHRGMK